MCLQLAHNPGTLNSSDGKKRKRECERGSKGPDAAVHACRTCREIDIPRWRIEEEAKSLKS